jgi:hypothetical protein
MIAVSNFRLLVLAAAACELLVSCSQYSYPDTIPLPRQQQNNYYIPNTVNMPLLQQKGQVKLNAGVSFSTDNTKYNGVEFQSSVAVSDHFALMVNAASVGRSNNDNTGKNNAFLAETGAGYLKKLNANWSFETFAGIGTGSNPNSHVTGTSTLRLTKFFAQPCIGFTNDNQTVQWGFASRFSAINFRVKEIEFSKSREAYSYEQLSSLQDHPLRLFWEPSMLLRAGGRIFQVQLQYTFSANLSPHNLNMDNGRLCVGFCLAIPPRSKTLAP